MTSELDALKAQLAMLREALASIVGEKPGRWGSEDVTNKHRRAWAEILGPLHGWENAHELTEQAFSALAATPADALARLVAKREKLAAANELDGLVRDVFGTTLAGRTLTERAAQLREEAGE